MIRLYRVILPSVDIEQSVKWWSHVLEDAGRRVSPGRHYYDVGPVILAVVDPRADGDEHEGRANSDHVYFAVEDVEAVHERVREAGVLGVNGGIETQPWGEQSFYARDPTGNPVCFVDARTVFTGRQ
jgi:catechol 2,3-dioxygenase-like lactoylglutathione lyase family enzyme